MRRGRVVLAGLVVLLGLAACHGGKAPNPSPSPTGANQPGRLSQAWQSVFDQVGPDGSVSTDTALQAFSLTFGPLPGVQAPAGDPGVIGDGTFAVRWLVAHWDDISAEQRSAAVAALPDLAGLGGGTNAPAVHLAARPMVRATAQRSDFFYDQVAQQEAADIGAKVGVTLTLKLTAKVGQPVYAQDLAETVPLDANGQQQGTPTTCNITISAKGDALLGDDLSQTMAHEVWHCFEAEFGGFPKFFDKNSYSWIIEGEAEWVGDTLYPNGSGVSNKFWYAYLDYPEVPLFIRTYSAVGFYSQLAQSGTDVWSKLIPILNATDNDNAFDVAGGNRDEFLDLWASGYARTPARGDAWDITGSAVPAEVPAPEGMAIGNGALELVSVPAYTVGWYGLAVSADVVTVAIPGHARVSDETGKDYLVQGQATFCHKSDGCDCPVQTDTPPTLPLHGSDIFLAVTGGPSGANGGVSGQSLQDFCKKKNLTGTWQGTWIETAPDANNGDFTVTWTQSGNTVSGTIQVGGTECVTQGTVDGQLDGQTITFGAVQGLRTINYTGTVSADLNSMSGTFDASTCGDAVGTWQAQRTSG